MHVLLISVSSADGAVAACLRVDKACTFCIGQCTPAFLINASKSNHLEMVGLAEALIKTAAYSAFNFSFHKLCLVSHSKDKKFCFRQVEVDGKLT